jgi:hypothetical protein
VRIFRSKWFSRFAKKEGITDGELRNIVNDLEKGLWDADLGGGVYKKRLARSGAGKSGGYRTIVFFKSEFRSFFVYGFAKSDRDNIDEDELQDLKHTAKIDFALTKKEIEKRLKKGLLTEIV